MGLFPSVLHGILCPDARLSYREGLSRVIRDIAILVFVFGKVALGLWVIFWVW